MIGSISETIANASIAGRPSKPFDHKNILLCLQVIVSEVTHKLSLYFKWLLICSCKQALSVAVAHPVLCCNNCQELL